MTPGTLYLVLLLALFVAGIASLFYFGWLRRREKPPPGVKPLPRDDDWD
ncbi:MAG TPA: hypothetical protein VK043_01385 [Burkholderiales bacterium]|nr:hypothetical protein [Burkholderiales bacterium]